MPPGLASVSQQIQAFFTVLFAAVALGERPARRQVIGMTAALVGVLLIALTVGAALIGSGEWRLLFAIGVLPAFLVLLVRLWVPESPRWLLRHGKYDEVRKAMATLGVENISDDDVRRSAEVVERVEGSSRESRRRAWTPGVRRALVVVSVFFIFQQITGINVPLYYGPHLLGPYFSGAHASLVDTTVAGVEVTLIMTAVNVAATYLGFRWIDKFGRKPLAIGGYTGMIVSALIAALGLAALSLVGQRHYKRVLADRERVLARDRAAASGAAGRGLEDLHTLAEGRAEALLLGRGHLQHERLIGMRPGRPDLRGEEVGRGNDPGARRAGTA